MSEVNPFTEKEIIIGAILIIIFLFFMAYMIFLTNQKLGL